MERVLREHATEVRVAEEDKDRAALWYGRLHAPDSVVASGKGFFIGDVTVPRNRIPEMQEAIQATAERHKDGLLFIAVWYLNPDYVMVLFTDPLGKKMLAVGVVMQILGALVIRKIVNIKV